MVLLESLISGHKVVAIRPRIKEEIQMLRYDPYGLYILVFEFSPKFPMIAN